VAVTAGASIGGNGTVNGPISLSGTISTNGQPGTLATGANTWNQGGRYVWSVNDADASLTPGLATGWSLLQIDGPLTINSTSGNRFVIDLRSLASGNAPGVVPNFPGDTDKSWTIATATGGISAFTGDQFFVQTTGFANVHPGQFAIVAEGNNLVLSYAAIPEISATGASAGALLVLAILMRRRILPDPLS
jgi:hypothetical protein